MKIKFLGAAKCVTGSFFVIDTIKGRFAVDCGLFQGSRVLEERNQRDFEIEPQSIDFLIVTHAHIDHIGLIPKLCKEGFKGRIYCSHATRELAAVMLLISLLIILVIAGIIASLLISRKFLQPISKGLELIKSEDLSEAPRTNVPEIDDLIEFLANRNQALYQRAKQKNLSFTLLDEFARNIETLSPSERSVYDLYAQGLTAKEIAETLYLSINTIKTHSKHIYSKLNITSRAELLLYVNLLKEIEKQ
jgi:DNA-binding CsgD family transcriptional regulator